MVLPPYCPLSVPEESKFSNFTPYASGVGNGSTLTDLPVEPFAPQPENAANEHTASMEAMIFLILMSYPFTAPAVIPF